MSLPSTRDALLQRKEGTAPAAAAATPTQNERRGAAPRSASRSSPTRHTDPNAAVPTSPAVRRPAPAPTAGAAKYPVATPSMLLRLARPLLDNRVLTTGADYKKAVDYRNATAAGTSSG